MLEMMLSLKPRAMLLYPDSGPGTKILKFGDTSLGYFGELAFGDLISIPELRRQVNFWGGVDQPVPAVWVKMFIDEKVIFFPKSHLAANVTWLELYNAGLTTGVSKPDVSGISPAVEQLRYAFIQDDTFSVRLFSATAINPTLLSGDNLIGSGVVHTGEWSRVMSAIASWVVPNYTGPKWNIYGSQFWYIDCWGGTSMGSTPASKRAMVKNTRITPAVADGRGGWLPVLELIPKDQIPLRTVDQQSVGTYSAIVPSIPDIGDSTPVILPIYRMGAAGITLANALSETTTIAGIDAIQRTSIAYTTTLPNALSADITFE